MNLRPTTFNRYIPQSFSVNSNQTLWRLKNRTIYAEAEDNQWLRNAGPKSELKETNIPTN